MIESRLGARARRQAAWWTLAVLGLAVAGACGPADQTADPESPPRPSARLPVQASTRPCIQPSMRPTVHASDRPSVRPSGGTGP